MDAEELKILVKNVDNELFEIINHLICSICQELFNKPVTTPCGHSFCNGCIRRVLSSKNNIGCPLCKNPVKRYNLEADKVKSTLSMICQELPSAFKKDVEDLSSGMKESAEDLIKRSKLFQLYNHDAIEETKTNKRKSSRNKKTLAELNGGENDVDSFVPVLKRSKKVIEYSSAKKKKMDELVSISQTEADLNISLCGPSDIDKKLEKIKKIPAEEKVKEWFDAVGDNIYINSPSSSLIEVDQKKDTDSKNQSSGRIRIDYIKSISPISSKENEKTGDPYEFIPSQNNKFIRKKGSKSRGKRKKIPQFKALQLYTKESLKRNLINQEQEAEQDDGDDYIDSPKSNKLITASQKFDNLLMETKEKEKKEPVKVHTLYSSSQGSSVKFLDISFQSKVEPVKSQRKSMPGVSQQKLLPSDGEENSNELFTSYLASQGKKRGRSKRKRSLDVIFKEEKKTKLNTETFGTKTTKLMDLLKELVNDDVIYCNSKKSPIKLEVEKPKTCDNGTKIANRNLSDDSVEYISQSTQLVGFGTQEEPQDVKQFKQMVANMEIELESEQNQVLEKTCTTIPKVPSKTKISKVLQKKLKDFSNENTVLLNSEEDQSSNVVPFNLLGKIKKAKNCFIEFIQLGRLTPTKRRSRSSVVKLVFPVGLSSYARRRSVPCKPKKSTSPAAASTAVQTSQIFKPATVENSSVEIQTSQKFTAEIEIQTSQTESRFKSTEIQTSQVPYNFAEAQTTQITKKTAANQTSQFWGNNAANQTSQVMDQEAKTSQSTQLTFSDKIQICNVISPGKTENVTTNNFKGTTTEEKTVPVADVPLEESVEKETPNSSRKTNYKHRKIYRHDSREPDKNTPRSSVDLCSPGLIDDNGTPKKSVESLKNLIVGLDVEKEFDEPWTRNTQKSHESLVELKNKKNIECNAKQVDEDSDDSDIQPIRRNTIPQIMSQDSLSPREIYETHQKIPLNVKKVSVENREIVIDLGTPNENSEDQTERVLKNIDMDLKGKKVFENAKSEKSEESDSDFFVEQTPPNPRISNTRWNDSSRITPLQPQPNHNKSRLPVQEDNFDKNDPESADLIGDSIPKALLETESFLMLSAPEKLIVTPKKSQKNIDNPKQSQKSFQNFLKPPTPFDSPKPNENDQNQLNADIPKRREAESQGKNFVGVLKRTESSQKRSISQRKKICIIASSVKNPELIKRFVSKFKLEYSNKLSKDMTHLIVGLHENEEDELLPLCTPKLLFAMANKKWVVSEMWAETCLKMNTILPEESFETLDPVGGNGCKSARLSRDNLLEQCEVCLIGEFQTITKEEFASLIVDCGGTLVSSPEKFSFSSSKIRMIVADRDCLSLNEKELQDLFEKHSTVILSRDVIIMSIQSYKLSNFTPYLLHVASENELVEKGYPAALVRSEEDEDEDMS